MREFIRRLWQLNEQRDDNGESIDQLIHFHFLVSVRGVQWFSSKTTYQRIFPFFSSKFDISSTIICSHFFLLNS